MANRSRRASVLFAVLACLVLGGGQPAVAAARLDDLGRRPVLMISGVIQPMEHCDVSELLADHPDIRQVVVDSPGGDAWAGAQLARLFGWGGLEAIIPEGASALSAAGIAVLGAPRRRIDGYLGLHRPYMVRVDPAGLGGAMVDETITEYVAVLREAGVTERTIEIALATKGSNIFYTVRQRAVDQFYHRGHPDRERIVRMAESCRQLGRRL